MLNSLFILLAHTDVKTENEESVKVLEKVLKECTKENYEYC